MWKRFDAEVSGDGLRTARIEYGREMVSRRDGKTPTDGEKIYNGLEMCAWLGKLLNIILVGEKLKPTKPPPRFLGNACAAGAWHQLHLKCGVSSIEYQTTPLLAVSRGKRLRQSYQCSRKLLKTKLATAVVLDEVPACLLSIPPSRHGLHSYHQYPPTC